MKLQALALATALLAGINAQATESGDTVRVFNNPSKVTITQTKREANVEVKGYDKEDPAKTYQFRVRQDSDGLMTTSQREDNDWDVRVPFKKKKTEPNKWEVFFNGVYVGWGKSRTTDDVKDFMGPTHEWGILNVIGVGYNFGGLNRNRLSLGVGYHSRWIYAKKDHQFESSPIDDAVVVMDKWGEGLERHNCEIELYTVQYPLLYNKGFNDNVNVFLGGILNWNCYAQYHNTYKVNNTKVDETTRGLRQRKVSFDAIAGINFGAVGAYFRYAPQSMFEKGYGPQLDRTWTLGLMLAF